jgi:Rrf2 family nitric oxide-sensitive transcriptional repressor
MLTQTTTTAIRMLIHVNLKPAGEMASLKSMAEQLGESPTYMAKVARRLVHAGILRALRGKMGGVVLNRPPEAITLLNIFEACQGAILGGSCQETSKLSQTCALHRAGAELREAMVGALSRWTLADLSRQPFPGKELRGHVPCLLEGGQRGLARAASAPTARNVRRRKR